MKRTRSYKDRKPEPGPLSKSVEENITPMQMETETPTIGHGRTEDLPNALGQMIATIIKEISKENGGLANLSRSLVGNSTSNVQMRQPHVDMDLEENESQLRQDPEFKQPELNAALAVIKKTMELDAADPFNRPVDPIELELPDYFDVIKTPMDFGTIRNNLENGLKYMNSADVFKDVQYIWNNCIKYNKKGDHILELMKRVKTFFMKCWKAAGLHTERLQTNVDALHGTESSIAGHNKRQKENSSAPVAYILPQLQQKEACSNQVAENQPVPINMQYDQPQQSSSQSQSSAEQYEANICTPDSTVTQKKRGFQQPRHCHKLLMTGGRIKIVTNELGQPVGREAAKLTSFLGLTARDGNLAPLNYPGWSKMPEENKENMWQKVLTKFDIDPSCRSWVLRSLESKWRNFKSHLKATHYDAHATDAERLADRDKRVLPDQWSVLVSQWSSDKFQRISAKNKANRAKVKFIHASGTKSFARLLEEERAKRPDGQEPSQAELFILTRTRKNGQPVNENTAAVISQLRESATEDDAYNRVMGEDREGGVLSRLKATPGTKNPTRAEALNMVKEKNAEVGEMKERLASVEQTCSQMAAQMSTMMSMMANMQKFFPAENISSDAAVGTLAPVGMPNQSEPPSTSNHVVPAKKTRGRKKRR